MKILIDENFPKKSISLLENYGYQVIDIRGTDNEGIDDEKIFQLAKNEKAIFVTTDKDFYHTIHFNHKPHFGIIVIALSQPNSSNIIEKLKWFLKTFKTDELKNKCFLLTNTRCKVYS